MECLIVSQPHDFIQLILLIMFQSKLGFQGTHILILQQAKLSCPNFYKFYSTSGINVMSLPVLYPAILQNAHDFIELQENKHACDQNASMHRNVL